MSVRADASAGVSTSGLPRLLDLSSERARSAPDKQKWSITVGILVFHALATLLALVSAILVGQSGQHADPAESRSALRPEGDVPGQLVLFFVLALFAQIGFAATSLLDGGLWLSTSWTLTASSFGLGLASTAMGAGCLAVAAASLSTGAFFVAFFQLLCACLAFGSTLAVAFVVLARSAIQQDLLSATAGTGADP